MNLIGTCSECGGPVVLPSHSVRPVPTCERCGATALRPYGAVIPMSPRERDISPYDLSRRDDYKKAGGR